MPPKGFTGLTVSNELKAWIKRVAEAEGLTMPDLIRKMLRDQYPDTPAGSGEEIER